jgi:hypothetical protein
VVYKQRPDCGEGITEGGDENDMTSPYIVGLVMVGCPVGKGKVWQHTLMKWIAIMSKSIVCILIIVILSLSAVVIVVDEPQSFSVF